MNDKNVVSELQDKMPDSNNKMYDCLWKMNLKKKSMACGFLYVFICSIRKNAKGGWNMWNVGEKHVHKCKITYQANPSHQAQNGWAIPRDHMWERQSLICTINSVQNVTKTSPKN